MEPVVTPAAMADADRRTIAAGVPEPVLMERAGRAVAWRVRHLLGGGYGKRVVVVCGKGNNGGDGLIAARVLRGWGARVDLVAVGAGDGVDRGRVARALGRADVAIDAMYGTGFRGVLEGDAAWIVDALGTPGVPVVAVDIPSGVDGYSGVVRGPAVRADATVTFAARKPGLLFEPGRAHAGDVHVADIGIDLGFDGSPPPMVVLDERDVASIAVARASTAHKWASGVMVVGGSRGMTGAPMLAGRAALRAGAGIVFCLLPGADAAVHASGSEVITRAVAAVDGALAPEAVPDVLERSARFRAVAVGPGLGGDAPAARAVRALVDGLGVPLVLDADGLNALDGDLAPLAERAARGGATVLTPHDGEYRRLVGRPVGDDRIEAARELAGRSGSVVLLKGPTTVIAEPPNPERRPGRIVLNATGTSLLASAGTGDVLTGVVAALLARGAPPFEAAAAAAWVHGRAAARVGPGLVAGDLVAALAPTLALERAGRDDAGAEHAQ